jgi:hypothetical protein
VNRLGPAEEKEALVTESFEDPTPRPEPRTRPRRGRTAGAAAALLVVAAAGATGVAAAADGTPTPSPTTSAPSAGEPGAAKRGMEGKARGWKGHHPGRHGGIGGVGMGALHGEFVTPKAGGGYETVAVQRGEVTAVSNDSLSVKSADGFTRTYVVTADTRVNAARDGIGSVETGHQVHVVAVVAGSTATLRHVGDHAFRPDRPGKGEKPAAPPEGTQTTPSGFSGVA